MYRIDLFAGALCALALMAACATPEISETIPPPTTPLPTTALPTTTTTTLPAVTLVPAASFEQAGAELLRAWRAGDRAAAEKVAQPQAVEVLFGHPPGPTQNRGCDQAQLGRDCAYRYGDRLLRLKVVRYGSGWIVEQVEVA